MVLQRRGMVLGYIRALVADHHLAEDLTQETMIAALDALDSFRPDADPGAWLRGIARNRVRTSRRNTARRRLVVDSEVVAGMEDVYAVFDGAISADDSWNDCLALVRACMEKLPGKLREATRQVYEAGRSIAEAAASLGAAVGAVTMRLARARDLVRECVNTRMGRTADA
jgi:RNA polymerase sigma-70 factor (ECF subfamily)